ncbi:hypothetical protein L195_g029337, partial [Trifolium pratense]
LVVLAWVLGVCSSQGLRYCLDGPVVFTDEVIWFCEDCEQEVVDADYPDEDTTNSEKGEVDSIIEDCVTVVDPQPIADPIWRGSLQVFHKSDDKTTRLMGHLSTLACLKVIEETRHLPNVLNADLLQRSAVWPASFAKFGTNNQSIGLYFFPQDERFERYYDQLVDEMISRDLAIRARVEKAELLIFPSTMLPSQYKSCFHKFSWSHKTYDFNQSITCGEYLKENKQQARSKIHDNASGSVASVLT